MTIQNYAIVRTAIGKAELQRVPLPDIPDDSLLVRTVTVALNPTDWTTLEAKGNNGQLVGCDYAGIVEKVGKGVKRRFVKGDRVAGISHGGNDANHQTGAFVRYTMVKGDLQQHIPDNVSFERACAVGVGLVTLGYALYKILGLPLPATDGNTVSSDHQDILIYGGSTATGTLAIQFAKLSGLRVLTTTSPKNFALLKKLGTDLIYDYRDPNHARRIHEKTHSRLSLVLDCVSTEATASACADAFGTSGGKYASLLGPDCPRSDVESTFFLGYSATGESYIFEGEHYDADPEFFEFSSKFAELAEKLWAQGKFVPHPQRLEKGGLGGIVESGLQILKDGKYSAEKLVYRVDETVWPEG